MSISMADLGAQYRALEEEINSAVLGVLKKGQFILGENVTRLESEVAEMCGAKYGISVASGTDAITIALEAVGLGKGDDVVTTPFTFVATTESTIIAGGNPVYADIEADTFNIDPKAVEKALTPKTKALLPVHLYGQCAKMDEILEIARKHNLKVVCDAAQAIGAEYKGQPIGKLGDAATLSFFPTKNLGAYGDGGMILTNDDDVAARAKSLRFHGMSSSYAYADIGYCSRLDEIQAAIIRVKLPHLKKWNELRRQHAAAYTAALSGTSIIAPVEEDGNYHIYHQYTVRAKNRAEVQNTLKEAGVGSAVYYPAPLHVQPAYEYLGYKKGDFPVSETASEQVFSLPVHPDLTDEQVETITQTLRRLS